MGAPRIAVSKIRRLAALHLLDRIPSISSLAKIIRVAKSTVVKYRGLIKASGRSFSDFAALLPGEMYAIFDQRAMRNRKPPQRYATLLTIFPQIQASLSDGTENLKQGWAGYKTHHPDGYEYSQFAAHFRSWRETQGLPTSIFTKWQVPHISQEDVDELKRWRRSNDRTRWAKAVLVIDSQRGIGTTNLSSKVEKSCRIVKSWIDIYKQHGILALRAKRKRHWARNNSPKWSRSGIGLSRFCTKLPRYMESTEHRGA